MTIVPDSKSIVIRDHANSRTRAIGWTSSLTYIGPTTPTTKRTNGQDELLEDIQRESPRVAQTYGLDP